jgi:hypothetical protein
MSFTKFYFRPGQGEQIETTVSLRQDARSVIHGYIKDTEGEAYSDAAVLIFEARETEDPKLISQMFTDEFGQFLFGPLDPGKLYLVKVFKNTMRLRELEGAE